MDRPFLFRKLLFQVKMNYFDSSFFHSTIKCKNWNQKFIIFKNIRSYYSNKRIRNNRICDSYRSLPYHSPFFLNRKSTNILFSLNSDFNYFYLNNYCRIIVACIFYIRHLKIEWKFPVSISCKEVLSFFSIIGNP